VRQTTVGRRASRSSMTSLKKAGMDIHAHEGRAEVAIACTRDWPAEQKSSQN
jgi:hypothetical protein